MFILNKTLWLLVIIFLLLLPTATFAQDSIEAQDSLEYEEDLPNLQLEGEGSDTYNDGTIVTLFTQGNETSRFDAKIHMRIIFVNNTILPVEIDCSSIPNFIIESRFGVLRTKALINGYVLIESKGTIESITGSIVAIDKQIIVSWDGKIQSGVLELNEFQVSSALSSKQEFFIVEEISNEPNFPTLVWNRFFVENNSLKNESGTYNINVDSTTRLYDLQLTPLIEGGLATIIFTENANKTIRDIYVMFIKELQNQFLLYSSTSGNELLYLSLVNPFNGSGYTLDFLEVPTFNYYKTNFLSNGRVRSIDTFFNHTYNQAANGDIIPLFYGGYMQLNFDYNTFFIYNGDDVNNIKVLNINTVSKLLSKKNSATLDDNFTKYTRKYIMQKQSIFWILDFRNAQTWRINYYPLKEVDNKDSRYIYQNLAISGTYPKINEIIQTPKSLELTIFYNQQIKKSIANITIYQYLNNNDIILRQVVSGRDDLCKLTDNNTAISITIFDSTLHQINARYGVKVDDNFAVSQLYEEPLLGISENIWTFKTFTEVPEMLADKVTITARLKFDNGNNNLFNDFNSKNITVFQKLKDELAQAIPIDSERLIINEKIQNENANNQILISITIKPPIKNDGTERNTDSVFKDLREMVKQKKYNNLSNGDITKFFDENYEVRTIPNFWEDYKLYIFLFIAALIILGCIIFYARYKYPEGKNFSIIKIILILYDLILDIVFVFTNANNVPGLPNFFVFSLLSVIIPIIINITVTIYSLIQEIMYNKGFNEWFKDNGLIISVFTVISSADVEALHILSSKIAGLQVFSAPPLSNKISKLIFLVGCVNIFLEDIPQFIIQIYFLQSKIVFTIIPTLTLISSSITLLIGVVGRIYFFTNLFKKKEKSDNLLG